MPFNLYPNHTGTGKKIFTPRSQNVKGTIAFVKAGSFSTPDRTEEEYLPFLGIAVRNSGGSSRPCTEFWISYTFLPGPPSLPPLQLHSSSPTFGIDCIERPELEEETLFTEYWSSGQLLGELSCLLREEVKYTAICETTLQVRPWLLSALLVNPSSSNKAASAFSSFGFW